MSPWFDKQVWKEIYNAGEDNLNKLLFTYFVQTNKEEIN